MAKTLRQSEAHWIESQKRWRCQVKSGNTRKNFYSSNPSRTGKREAERKADAWLAMGAPDTQLRFGAAWQRFLDHEKKVKGEKSASYIQHEQYGRLYILPLLEYKKLVDMVPLDWKRCIDENYARSIAAGKELSSKTLKNIRGALSAFSSFCGDAGISLCGYKPLKIPHSAEEKERVILQPDDVYKLFNPSPCKCNTHYLHAWRFQALVGMRPGELYGLKHEDITDNIVTIKRSINYRHILTKGKNKNAHRVFVLGPLALKVLEDQKAFMKSIGVISPYVFPDEYGNITRQRVAADRWDYFASVQGISNCSPYEMRHTTVSVCVGVPDPLLKMVIGHSKNMDTRGVYNHEMKGSKELAAKLMDDAFANLLSDHERTKERTSL